MMCGGGERRTVDDVRQRRRERETERASCSSSFSDLGLLCRVWAFGKRKRGIYIIYT